MTFQQTEQFTRRLADTSGFRDPVAATRIALKSLARRILELNDEIADLDQLITTLVGELAPQLVAATGHAVTVVEGEQR